MDHLGSDSVWWLYLENYLANSFDRGSNDFSINIWRVLFKLLQNLVAIIFVRNFDQNVDLLNLDIHWVVELAIEHLGVILKNLRLFLQNEADVSKGHVLELWLTS